MQVVELRDAKLGERLAPDQQGAGLTSLLKDNLPVREPHPDEIGIVVEIDEIGSCRRVLLACQIRQLVVAIEMNLEGLARGLIAGEKLFLDVGFAGGREQRRTPVEPTDDFVGNLTWLDAARPSHHAGNAERAFP